MRGDSNMSRQRGFVEPSLQRFTLGESLELEVHADNSAFFVVDDERSGEVHYPIPRESSPLWRMLAHKLDTQIPEVA
jgi:hypothetical protein